jgi:hypothetical protein
MVNTWSGSTSAARRSSSPAWPASHACPAWRKAASDRGAAAPAFFTAEAGSLDPGSPPSIKTSRRFGIWARSGTSLFNCVASSAITVRAPLSLTMNAHCSGVLDG